MRQLAAAFDSGRFLLIRSTNFSGWDSCPGNLHDFVSRTSSNSDLGASVRRCLSDSRPITKEEYKNRPHYDKMDNAEIIAKYGHKNRKEVYEYMLLCYIEANGEKISFLPTCRIRPENWEHLTTSMVHVSASASDEEVGKALCEAFSSCTVPEGKSTS
jgi:hypothetical protein